MYYCFFGVFYIGICFFFGGIVLVLDYYDCRNLEFCDEEEMIGEVCGFDGVIYSRWENLNLGRICFVVEDDI